MTRKEAHVLTLAQTKEVLRVMQYPEEEMALIAILTSMNLAEICGLQWKRVNLTEKWAVADSEPIPPRAIAVRKQWRRSKLLSVIAKRNRNLSIPEPLLPVLLALSRREEFTGPDDFVFVSRAGRPLTLAYELGMRFILGHSELARARAAFVRNRGGNSSIQSVAVAKVRDGRRPEFDAAQIA